MDHIKVRNQILKILFDQREKDAGVDVSADQMAREIGVTTEDLLFDLDFLAAEGFIRIAYMGNGGYYEILSKGIKYHEGSSPFNQPDEHSQLKMNISNSTVGNVVQAKSIEINGADFLHQLASQIDALPNLDSSQKKDWKRSLLEMARNSAVSEAVRSIFRYLAGT